VIVGDADQTPAPWELTTQAAKTKGPRQGAKTKAQRVAEEVARAVGAGRAVAVETVDFSDPKRPKTCLEVDFPILPVNQVAAIEGNAGKPIYQMSKWWARRRSSVFRSLLLSASMKAPDDPAKAAKAVWDVYYANHQKRGALSHLKVADIFMGGGTTIVEGSRLGMQMFGNDLNPVAWFVVKTELAQVKKEEVSALLADIEAEVKPQIMPFYACRGPHGEKGTWTRVSNGEAMGESFDPLALTPGERKDFRYDGPEIIYVFWAKHGPCQVTGCDHRTPIMASPIVAVKELTVKAWRHTCDACGKVFDVEDCEARMAPDVPLVLAPDEQPFAHIGKDRTVVCPHCLAVNSFSPPGKAAKKKVTLSLLVHPQWLQGAPGIDSDGSRMGGAAQNTAASSSRWYDERARRTRLLEVRGSLPATVLCPDTGVSIDTTKATIAKKSAFACGACGAVQDVLTSITAHGHRAPMAAYAVQGYSSQLASGGAAYGGRFFAAVDDVRPLRTAAREWEERRNADLASWWPTTAVPEGFKTTYQRIPEHGYATFADMFNARQMLVLAQLLKAIVTASDNRHRPEVREYVLGAFQQYLRNQNMFCFWDLGYDKLVPHMSNNNYYPKNTPVENGVFSRLGRGNWASCADGLLDNCDWIADPWDLVATEFLAGQSPQLRPLLSGRSEKARPGDPCDSAAVRLGCCSSSDLSRYPSASFDLVVTDPPFGNNVQYAELADFFHVWLRLPLKDKYEEMRPELTPKTLEAVDNPVRNKGESQRYYQRLLTQIWGEASRILKPAGLLVFTFHHSEDAPWVSVLESLFDAGLYLEAAYPIRSDETKGEGSKPGTFGSQQIEYDIVHVCRRRTEDPSAVSWAKMRRQVLQDVRGLQSMLEHHQKAGLPDADLQVIRRGKALEYYSRHYGKVLVDDGRPMSVLEALVGINQLLDEETGGVQDPPPVTAEPFTRQLLRLFDGVTELPRDQIQKFLRGTGIAPSDFEERGWCREEKKIYHLTPPLEIARAWQGKHRRGLTSDYDQAAFLIGACFENSGINATDTLANDNFKPHPALASLLDWFTLRGASSEVRNAASRAQTILRSWRTKHEKQAKQMSLFFEDEP
jgi:hypothetical protein